MQSKFLVETERGLLNLQNVDLLEREEDGEKFYLVAIKQERELHRWTFQNLQDRESALLVLKKEFNPLRIQFSY